MILAVDVHYEERAAQAAGVGFEAWDAAEAIEEIVVRRDEAPAPYEPGEFYRRELTHLLAVFDEARRRGRAVDVLIVDGHVWLDAGRPGLGAHVAREVGGGVAVIGVAKTSYKGGVAVEVRRGGSAAPLYVSADGMDIGDAAAHVRAMHGPFRIPTLLKRVDRLARGG